MGMAASQARYLELTARKTNVEFEGQQINQQRTELANQSAGMFAKLMDLVVPTAPSSADFTTTSYTFDDGNNKCTITNIRDIHGSAYNSEVTYYYTQSIYTGVAKNRTDQGVRNNSGTYWLTDGISGGRDDQKLSQCKTEDPDYLNDKAALDQIVKDTGSSTNLATDYASNINNIYKYTLGGVTHYYSVRDLNSVIASHPDGSAASLTGYYAADIDKKIYKTERADVKKADSGRSSTIQLESMGGTELSLTAENVTDQNAFKDAMNEYEYKQQIYQQEVNNINARTSIVQAQDRTLELKLKQLDTEQEALSTELESVKKVIDKNIDQTFKTFQ